MISVLQKIADLGAGVVPNYELIGFPRGSLEHVDFDDLSAAVEAGFKGSEREIRRLVEERGVSNALLSGKTNHVLLLQERLGAAGALWRFIPMEGALISFKKNVSDEDVIRWLLLDWWPIAGALWYSIWVKSAEPALEMNKKLKRKITYFAEDGTAFDSRTAARKHELDSTRKARIEKCLRAILPNPAALDWDGLVSAMVLHAGKLSDALSARAAARTLPNARVAERKGQKRPS
jgi:hypothetical protein